MPGGLIISGGGGSGIPGARPRNYNPASGGIPGVTSPIDTITSNLGGLGNLISSITGQQSSALRSQYPDQYFSTLGTLLGNTGRRAKGDISDLLPELQQSSAERAVYGGMSGSEAENTKLLRDLGLTRYGVENQALKDLGTVQSEIPTVRPFDPSAMINEQLAAQERADLYASAPVPEEAYQRAMTAAGGAGGRGTPGLRYDLGGGGGPVRPVDSIMGGYGGPVIGYGSGRGATPGGGFDPWGSMGAGGDNQDPFGWLFNGDTSSANPNDFGGGLDYGGGAPWEGLNTDLFGGPSGSDFSGDLLSTDYGPASGDLFDQNYS